MAADDKEAVFTIPDALERPRSHATHDTRLHCRRRCLLPFFFIVPWLPRRIFGALPWMPTVAHKVEAALDVLSTHYGPLPGKRFVDLGSGDGVAVIAATRRGMLSHSVELNPSLVASHARVHFCREWGVFQHVGPVDAAAA